MELIGQATEPEIREGPNQEIHRYPSGRQGRDRWILARRGRRTGDLDSRVPYAFFAESEPDGSGNSTSVATIFLTNGECPWRCLTCDLWKNTLPEPVEPGAIPEQIRHALARLRKTNWIKLYNAGSFFDPRAIPPADLPEIAKLVSRFQRVIVECHPALVGRGALEFRELIDGKLELAMGLESADPGILRRLNKGMDLNCFRKTCRRLDEAGVAVRAFILVQPPFTPPVESVPQAVRSADFAFEAGAETAVLIPTRPGNGALDELARQGLFKPPALPTLEAAMEGALELGRGRVLADLWDLEQFSVCPDCFKERRQNMETMNRTQRPTRPATCPSCEDSP